MTIRLGTVLRVVSLWVAFAFGTAPPILASSGFHGTPAGESWQKMHKEIQGLIDELPADENPPSSREAQRRIEVMKRIIVLYQQAHTMFKEAVPATGDPDQERQWHRFMARNCRAHGDNWRKKASSMEGIANALKSKGN